MTPGELANPVRRLLEDEGAEIVDWQTSPIGYANIRPDERSLIRVSGTALCSGQPRQWSLIAKTQRPGPDNTAVEHHGYWRREALAYESGLLDDLPSGLAAPRLLGSEQLGDGGVRLWLEDLGSSQARWPIARYGLAARHIGRLNGAHLARLTPTWSWLSRQWVRGWCESYPIAVEWLRRVDSWPDPIVQGAFPSAIGDQLMRLNDRHPDLLDALDRLPTTLCHGDFFRPNLFARRRRGRDETVAIDWAFLGLGPLGAEPAQLVVASLIWCQVEAADALALDRAVFDGYLRGLRDAGWRGDPAVVRFGFAASAAARWGLIGLFWLAGVEDPQRRARFEGNYGRPLLELARHWGEVTRYVMGLAEEALASSDRCRAAA